MTETQKVIDKIKLTDILADDKFNCRGVIAPIDVVDLVKDIEIRGLIQPIVIAPMEDGEKPYRLIAGFRRHMAHRVLERETIECIIREDMMDEVDATYFNLAENIQRKELNVLQESFALRKLRDMGCSRKDVAEHLNMSQGWVQIRFMVLDLPHEIQQEIAAGFCSHSQIRELHSVYNAEGKEGVFEAARKIKDAKARGRVISVNPNQTNPDAKRHRRRAEIFNMQEHIQELFGNNLGTRMLAWCAGEISDADLFMTCKAFADKQGLIWREPGD